MSIIVICSPHFRFGPWVLVERALHSSFPIPTLIPLLLRPCVGLGVGGQVLGLLDGPGKDQCWGSQDTLHNPCRQPLGLAVLWHHPCDSLALEPPTPTVPFTCFPPPQKSGGGGEVVGTSPVKEGLGRGGDRFSGILYCSDNTNSGGNGREKTRPLKLLVV